jgi:hypothetical protein
LEIIKQTNSGTCWGYNLFIFFFFFTFLIFYFISRDGRLAIGSNKYDNLLKVVLETNVDEFKLLVTTSLKKELVDESECNH